MKRNAIVLSSLSVVFLVFLVTAVAVLLIQAHQVHQGDEDQNTSQNTTKQQNPNTLDLPKRIYTYWNTTEIPQFINLCIENWKRMNPTYEVRLITPATVKKFVKHPLPRVFKELEPAHQADWIRLAVLKENGGFWLDASTILTTDLEFVENFTKGKEAFLYYSHWLAIKNSDTYFPMCENSFMAFKPHSPVMKAWFHEYDKSLEDFGTDGLAYARSLKKNVSAKEFQGYHQKFAENNWNYYRAYLTLQRAIRHEKIPFDKIERIESTTAPHGIYYIWHLANGNDSLLIDLFTRRWNESLAVPSVVKMTSYSRKIIVSRMQSKNFAPSKHSLYARFVDDKNAMSTSRTSRRPVSTKPKLSNK